MFETAFSFIGILLGIMSLAIHVYRLLKERTQLRIKVLECYWENIPENGSRVSFKLNVNNRGDRGTSIMQVRLLKFDGEDVKGKDWVLQNEAQEYGKTGFLNSLPRKDLPASRSIELKGLFNFGKHLEVKDYPLEIEISHTHGIQTIKATAKCSW